MSVAELQEYVRAIDDDRLPHDMRRNNHTDLCVAAAEHKLNLSGDTVHRICLEALAVSEFVYKMENQYGRFPFIRMRNDFIWDTIRGQMKYRDFAVLASIYSVIGAKQYPVRITRKRIIAGALGYKSPAMLTPAILSSREDNAQPLTENQLRRTLDGLEARGLFARVQASQRKVYFSHRMTREEMAAKIHDTHVKRATKISLNRQEDRLLREKITAAIKAVNSTNSLSCNHRLVTTFKPDSNHETTALIKSSFIESDLKETKLKKALPNTAVAGSYNSSRKETTNKEKTGAVALHPLLDQQDVAVKHIITDDAKNINADRGLNHEETGQQPTKEQFIESRRGMAAFKDEIRLWIGMAIGHSFTGNHAVFDRAMMQLPQDIILNQCAYVVAWRKVNVSRVDESETLLINRFKQNLGIKQ